MAKKPKDNSSELPDGPGETQGAAPSQDNKLTLTIQGIRFQADAPYAEGHPLSELEASALNNLRGENLRNNFASRVKKALDDQQAAEKQAGVADEHLSKELSAEAVAKLRDEFTKYDAEYSFSVRGTRQPVDPVEAEALKIARSTVRAALSANKIDIKGLPEGKVDELAKSLIAKRPDILDEARRRVEAVKSIVGDSLDLVNPVDFAQSENQAQG